MTQEFERVVEREYTSGSLSYTTLIRLLYGQSIGDRRCRKTVPKHDSGDLIARCPKSNPKEPVKAGTCDSNVPVYSPSTVPFIVAQYVSGSISTEAFVQQLESHGIPIVPELEQLIRRHEADNSVTFKEFARVLLWMGVCNM